MLSGRLSVCALCDSDDKTAGYNANRECAQWAEWLGEIEWSAFVTLTYKRPPSQHAAMSHAANG